MLIAKPILILTEIDYILLKTIYRLLCDSIIENIKYFRTNIYKKNSENIKFFF